MIKKLLLILALFCAPAYAFDDAAFLRSIAQRETNNDNLAIGRAGELSKYQFTKSTWYIHTRAPFSEARSNEKLAEKIAAKHLTYIKLRLQVNNKAVNIDNCAWAWNAGIGSVLRADLPESTVNYIADVRRIYSTQLIARPPLTITISDPTLF